VAKSTRLSDLERRLGYNFVDKSLLNKALTHASARTEGGLAGDNERLEFLGDRVLGLSVAQLLFEAFPDKAEGELAKRYNRLVRRETCASVGGALRLADHVRLGQSATGSAGRRNTAIVSNACEAVLGAIFMDAGFAAADAVVRAHWGPLLDELAETPADAKSVLQEWAQGHGRPLPSYRQVSRSGPDHAPTFEVEVHVEGVAPARGTGASKRFAEQAAAGRMLQREGVWDGGGSSGGSGACGPSEGTG